MKKLLYILGAASMLSTPMISSAGHTSDGVDLPGEFSATVAFVSEYSFRGVAQSDENPAIQGSIDWSHDLEEGLGLYSGVWASNVDFNDSDEANTEFNIYAGASYGVDNWNFDIGGIYYVYPGASSNLNYDYFEFVGSVGYDFEVVSLSASLNYSPENFGESGDAQYYMLAAEIPLPHEFSLSAHVGRQEIDDNATFGLPNYTDWGIGLGYTIEGFDLTLQYIDTDLNETECADGCDEKLIFSISRSF